MPNVLSERDALEVIRALVEARRNHIISLLSRGGGVGLLPTDVRVTLRVQLSEGDPDVSAERWSLTVECPNLRIHASSCRGFAGLLADMSFKGIAVQLHRALEARGDRRAEEVEFDAGEL